MPEIAEVETVVRGLQPIVGHRVVHVRFGKTDFIDNAVRLAALLPGKRISEIRRHGKLLLMALNPDSSDSDPFWLMIHLGMTGQLVLRNPADPVAPHTHVWFSLDDGRELRYVDIRRFGHMRLASREELAVRVGRLGADPLELSEADFRARLGLRRARLKALLLDQKLLRGLGNIYADESLWRAQLHPMRLGSELTPEETSRLWRSIRAVVREAIRRRGTSISNYVDAQGCPGSFQERLRVYRRTGLACPRCGARIERIIVAGRSSHFCPQCQPERPAAATGGSRRARTRRNPAPRR